MDTPTLARAMGNSLSLQEYEAFTEPFNKALISAECTTVDRVAMWCAQIGHESAGLRFMEEIADGSDYEGRLDLGNTEPGDGPRFKGRGPIQLTGRHNYGLFSAWAFDRGLVPNPDFFVSDPFQVARPEWGFLAASYYWTVARPQLNELADTGDVEGATRAVNGGTMHLQDRIDRWHMCRELGTALLPDGIAAAQPVERVLDYPRIHVKQDTGFNCGPASTQTVILARTNDLIVESDLGQEMGTDEDGTDHIGLIGPVLDKHIPGADYKVVQMPDDPPSAHQREQLWADVTRSIDNGYGVVANIVAPPGNYPVGVRGSTSPEYHGGTVFHYIAIMGYADDNGGRAFWVADSGFPPFGYWCSFAQMATLIPPKGYAAATGTSPSGRRTVDDCVLDAWLQLVGVDGAGWPQLNKRSVVDALADIGTHAAVAGMVNPPASPQPMRLPDTTVGRANDVFDQIRGPGGNAWNQLGHRTIVDAIGAIARELHVPGHWGTP
ncbi:C39 family peptidase [Nocardia thailandica]|uniref:C39 family peptidase n=1 Tax=Nocardia thailandica TaxID=257275 RepID=UPI00031AECA3|nr:C39 family peptidase [Nocardia thailandica]